MCGFVNGMFLIYRRLLEVLDAVRYRRVLVSFPQSNIKQQQQQQQQILIRITTIVHNQTHNSNCKKLQKKRNSKQKQWRDAAEEHGDAGACRTGDERRAIAYGRAYCID
jgi:hypothetical protein